MWTDRSRNTLQHGIKEVLLKHSLKNPVLLMRRKHCAADGLVMVPRCMAGVPPNSSERCVLGVLCSQRCKTHVKGIIKHSPNRLAWDLLSKSWSSPSKYREEGKAGSKQEVFLWSLKISKGFKSWSPEAAAVLQVAYFKSEPCFKSVCVVLPSFEEGEWEWYGGAELSIGVTPQRPPLSFTQRIELKEDFLPLHIPL